MTLLTPDAGVFPSLTLQAGNFVPPTVPRLTTSAALRTGPNLTTGSLVVVAVAPENLRIEVVIVTLAYEVEVTTLPNGVDVKAEFGYAAEVEPFSSENPIAVIGP